MLTHVQQGHEAIARGLQAIGSPRSCSWTPDEKWLHTLSAADAVRQAVDRFAYDAADQRGRVQVVVEQDFRFRADPTAVELVFFNR